MDNPLCVCGHFLLEHRISWAARSGRQIVEECLNPQCDEPSRPGAMPLCLHFKEAHDSR